ncbi:MAG TPA: TadE/TadG family type IV pilus assembly protein [Mycobacteriales bacterium]|nr:TadE/TadG family type IV pilus assembly protein [Mycobacteriales bacterium]
MSRILARVRRDDRGSFALELAVLAPVILALFVFIWEAGQVVTAENRLQSATREIAREMTANGLTDVDSSAAQFILKQAGYDDCDVRATQSGAGVTATGAVDRYQTVHLDCRISLLAGVTKTISASATSRQDPFRSGPDNGVPSNAPSA